MPLRLKKLIGMLLLVTLVIVYALVATSVASATLGGASGWVHLTYFALSGLLWVVPAMLIIRWMAGPKSQD